MTGPLDDITIVTIENWMAAPSANGPQSSAPSIGEHTQEILRGAGYDDETIQALIDSGALRPNER